MKASCFYFESTCQCSFRPPRVEQNRIGPISGGASGMTRAAFLLAFIPIGALAFVPKLGPASALFGRASVAVPSTALNAPPATSKATVVEDNGRRRLPFKREGYEYWKWRDHNIHFVSLEPESGVATKPPVVLIHGFGASAFHWRYNAPEIARAGHRVFAMDLLGFGLSDKPIIEYNAEVWRDQLAEFLREVVGCGGDVRAIVVGNSLGGYTVLKTSAFHPELVSGCAVLNGAGTFDPEEGSVPVAAAVEEEKRELALFDEWKTQLATAVRRLVLWSAFVFTKRPQRIKQVLEQVYIDKSNVDDELVESIRFPSEHPNAAEVFYRVVSRTSTRGALVTVNQLLNRLTVPLLLLWGDKDPWIGPSAAERMLRLYPTATRDEAPDEVNRELLGWIEQISTTPAAPAE